MKSTYTILEVANVHGGDINYVLSLLDEVQAFDQCGIKFQPLSPDLMATEDYEWYNTYHEIAFSRKQWSEILAYVPDTQDIWLDIYDGFSVDILEDHLSKVAGIKIQSTVLETPNIQTRLRQLSLNHCKCMLNVSGRSLDEISTLCNTLESYALKEIILQFGFQNYPTSLADCGLHKIAKLREQFNYPLAFGDHIDAADPLAIYLPLLPQVLGVQYIEKHIRHSTLETKYDFYSSLTASQIKDYFNTLTSVENSLASSFITEDEAQAFQKTLFAPILATSFTPHKLLSTDTDLAFKRSPTKGLSLPEIKNKLESFHLLSKDKEANTPLFDSDFKKARIAAIVACRMKSSRLPKKALLKIGNLTSIETCLKHTLSFSNTDLTILASSDLEEDAILEDHCFQDKVIFHKGHPTDVIARYLDAVDAHEIDVIIRITGDMPYVTDEILQQLLRSHFETGADFTTANKASIGTNLEIISVCALKRLKALHDSTELSEYMTFYFVNNPSHFRLNYVDLPEEFVTPYRLTLDYQEDLALFNAIDEALAPANPDYRLKDILKFLKENPEIAALNKDCHLCYKTDSALIEKLNKATTLPEKA